MSTAAKVPPITVEQYEAFEGFPGLRDELIYGEIVMSPQPKPLHQQIVENVQELLRELIRNQPYVAKQSSNVKFPAIHSMPAPDVFVVSKTQWREACTMDTYLSDPPVLSVEVISPANRKARVEQKIELYLSQGVRQVWTVYPKKKIVRVYGPNETAEFSGTQSLNLPEPIEGYVKVDYIFRLD